MSGSPRKRARREAKEREKNMAAGIANKSAPSQGPVPESPAPNTLQRAASHELGDGESGHPAGGSASVPAAYLPAPAVTPLKGEVLPPENGAPEPTRTAQKRAMRAKAQAHADAAIAVLVANMNDPKLNAKDRADAANKLLEWGHGKPGLELGDAADGGLLVMIQRFAKEDE